MCVFKPPLGVSLDILPASEDRRCILHGNCAASLMASVTCYLGVGGIYISINVKTYNVSHAAMILYTDMRLFI